MLLRCSIVPDVTCVRLLARRAPARALPAASRPQKLHLAAKPLAPTAQARAFTRERAMNELLAIDVLEAWAAHPALALIRPSVLMLEQQSGDKALLDSRQAIVRVKEEGQTERGTGASPVQPLSRRAVTPRLPMSFEIKGSACASRVSFLSFIQ